VVKGISQKRVMPNRPLCHACEFIVGKGAKGIVLVSLGGAGTFMKCQ
jgi:hypothetical protein